MEPVPERGARLRFVLAISLLAIAAAGTVWWLPGDQGGEQQEEPSEPFIEFFERWRREAERDGRHMLLSFHRDQSIRWRDDPEEAFEREILDVAEMWDRLSERYVVLGIRWGEENQRDELPENLQWWAHVQGGLDLLRKFDGGDADFGEQLEWIPSLIVCDARGKVFGFPPTYKPGDAEPFVEELLRMADDCDAFAANRARVHELQVDELDDAVDELFERLDVTVLLSRDDLLREVSALDPDRDSGAGQHARELLELRAATVASREVFEIAMPLVWKVSPERMRNTLMPFRELHGDKPLVLQTVEAFEAWVDLRLTINDQQREKLLKKLRAAIALDERTGLASQLREFAERVESELGR